jgi:hypothetical protein
MKLVDVQRIKTSAQRTGIQTLRKERCDGMRTELCGEMGEGLKKVGEVDIRCGSSSLIYARTFAVPTVAICN